MKIKQLINKIRNNIDNPEEIAIILLEFESAIKHKDYDKIDITEIEKIAETHSGKENIIAKYAYMVGVLQSKIEDIKDTLF